MTLLNPDAHEDDFADLDSASAAFLRAINTHYSRDAAVDVMDALTPILGKAWKGRLVFNKLADKHQGLDKIAIMRDHTLPDRKINAIKALRSMTGMGLTESKNLIEASVTQRVVAHLERYENSIRKQIGMTLSDYNQHITGQIQELRSAGYKVTWA